MRTIKAVILIGLIAICSVTLSAQQKEVNSEQKAKRQTKWMVKELNLTPEQESKVAEINLKYLKLIDEAQNTIANETERKSMVKEYQMQRMAALKEVLTPEQFEKLKKLLQERRNNRNEN